MTARSVAFIMFACAALLSALAARSALVFDCVVAQTTGPLNVNCRSDMGMASINVLIRHVRWADEGVFGEYGDDWRTFDHGVMYNCFLRSSPNYVCDPWGEMRRSYGKIFVVCGLAVKGNQGPPAWGALYVPYWMLIASASLGGSLALACDVRRRRRERATGKIPCAACGYDLRGTPTIAGSSSRRCSECGKINGGGTGSWRLS